MSGLPLSQPLVTERDYFRFWSRVLPSKDSDCWEWIGPRDRAGYGYLSFRVNGGYRIRSAPRIAMATFASDIPAERHVCHSCDNPACVNPAHLWLGTSAENNQDKMNKGRHFSPSRGITHCKRGHEFTPENTHRFPTRSGGVGRRCRQCTNARSTKYRQLAVVGGFNGV